MKELMKSEQETHKVIILGALVLLIVVSLVSWVKVKKAESWKVKYEEAIQVCLQAQPDSAKREQLIKKLK